jgi:D-alanine-D-alanine ligase
MIRQRYTGCNPYGLMLTHNKAVAKKILRHHRVRVPEFAVFPRRRRRVKKPARLKFPLFVKSATEHGSVGISQASVVYDEEKLWDRIAFVHDQLLTDALVEEYIDGREIYVGVMGNKQLRTFTPWELHFKNLPEGAPRVATSKVKWDLKYQKERGVDTRAAELSADLARRIEHTCKRVYRLFEQTGYARLDLRVTDDERIYVLESNPNPQLEYGEDFAESAEATGVSYTELLQRIITLGMNYMAPWRE